MEFRNLVTASRIKKSDLLENLTTIQELDKVDDIVTTVNGTSKPLLNKNNWKFENKSEDLIRYPHSNDSKLQVRRHNFRERKGKKLMNKSCERIFECIKPFKHVSVFKETHITQSSQFKKTVLKTNQYCYQEKTTRRVHFLSICEKTTMPFAPSECGYSKRKRHSQLNEESDWESEDIKLKNETRENPIRESKKILKVISSEDFIQNVSLEKPF